MLCGLFIRPITKASLWLVSRTVQLVRRVFGEAGLVDKVMRKVAVSLKDAAKLGSDKEIE